jgi:hypothetical protein
MAKNAKNGWKRYVYLIMFIPSAVLLYLAGIPLYYIILTEIILISLFLLKGRFYKRIDVFLSRRFPVLSRARPWVRKLMIIVVVILIYLILKQMIFLILRQFGIDVQQMITDGVSRLVK